MSSQERYKILLDMEREKQTLDFEMLNLEINQLIITGNKISEVSAEMLRCINVAISRLQDLEEKLASDFERQNMKQIKEARKQKALYMLDDNEENEQYFIG